MRTIVGRSVKFEKMVKVICGLIALGLILYIPIWRQRRCAHGCKMLEKTEKSLEIPGIAPVTHELNDKKSITVK